MYGWVYFDITSQGDRLLCWLTSLTESTWLTMHYHEEGYKSDNDYGLPAQVMKPTHIYSVFSTEAFISPAVYKETKHTISPFTPR